MILNLVVCAVLQAAVGTSAHVQSADSVWIEDAVLTDPNGHQRSRFGTSVALWEDRMVVGAIGSDVVQFQSGVAYAYLRGPQGWTLESMLVPPQLPYLGGLGSSVAIEDSLAVVGAPLADIVGQNSGSAFLFQRAGDGTWSFLTELQPSEPGANVNFGVSVAIGNGRVLVGGHTQFMPDSRIYVFDLQTDGTYAQSEVLVHSDPQSFGSRSSALFGSSAVVGSDLSFHSGSSSGAAHVWRLTRGGAQHEALVLPLDGEADAHFGFSVAGHADHLIVGAVFDEFSHRGSAYVFRKQRGAWVQAQKLEPALDDQVPDARFGEVVAVRGSRAFVTARNDASSVPYVNTYVRRPSGEWALEAKISGENGPQGDGAYGTAMAVGGGRLAVAAPYAVAPEYGSGAVHVYRRGLAAPR